MDNMPVNFNLGGIPYLSQRFISVPIRKNGEKSKIRPIEYATTICSTLFVTKSPACDQGCCREGYIKLNTKIESRTAEKQLNISVSNEPTPLTLK